MQPTMQEQLHQLGFIESWQNYVDRLADEFNELLQANYANRHFNKLMKKRREIIDIAQEEGVVIPGPVLKWRG